MKDKEFIFDYRYPLFEAYESCIQKGVMYNEAFVMIDTMAAKFKAMSDTICSRSSRQHHEKLFFTNLVKNLQKYDDLDAFFNEYAENNNMVQAFEYAIVVRHLGILLNDTIEAVAYDNPEGMKILGNLQTYNTSNKIVDARNAIKDYCLLDYALYADIPQRQFMLWQQMSGILALSVLSIAITLLTFVYTIRNWLKQQKLSDMKSDFINNISHELKTPLATIAVASKSLQNEKIRNNRSMTDDLLEVNSRQTKRLQKLIDQVLDLKMWEKGTLQLDKVAVNLNEFLENLINDFKLRMEEDKKVNIEINFADFNDKINIDKFHFTTAIYNLLDNAVKYSEEKASIRIRSSRLNNKVNIEVSDKGIGMNRRTQQYIFEKFYRGQQGNIHTIKGLGLGLYFVKKSIEAHGGVISVKSQKGRGSTFTIILPID